MRRLMTIVILMTAYVLFSARSCNSVEEQEERAAENSADSLRRTFALESPSEDELTAFEHTAVQKLYDVADYHNIRRAPALSPAMKNKAGAMIRAHFVSDTAMKSFEQTVAANVEKDSLQIGAVRIAAPLKPESKDVYRGRLVFGIRGIGESRCDIHLRKIPKVFGKDTLEVWTVLLGDIRLVGP